MAEDQTLEETTEEETSDETSEKTAEEKDTPKETEPKVDYKVKFRESQKEAIRLAKELKELKKVPETEAVETETEGETLDQIVDRKVQEKLAPLTKQQQEEAVDKWLDKNPDAIDYLQQIEDNYNGMPGKTISEKLENAFLVAKKDAMKNAGKKEMAFALYQKEQAVASGGVASASKGESAPSLTEEQKKVALSLGLTEEAYAKHLKKED